MRFMDFIVKVGVDRGDRIEYVTSVLVRDTNREGCVNEAFNFCKRAQWLRLSDIELKRLVAMEIKTY